MLAGLKPVRQSSGLCGPASLRMVLTYFGFRVSERVIARRAGATREKGVGAQPLLTVAKEFGLRGFIKDRASIRDLERLTQRGTPVIVDWFSGHEGHYSVVVGVNRRSVVLMDPELGRRLRLRRDAFLRVWFDFPGPFLRSPRDLILRRMIVVRP